MEFWIDVLGWMGALLILLAYALISSKQVEGNSLSYQMLNIFASIFLTVKHFLLRRDSVNSGKYYLGDYCWVGDFCNIEKLEERECRNTH